MAARERSSTTSREPAPRSEGRQVPMFLCCGARFVRSPPARPNACEESSQVKSRDCEENALTLFRGNEKRKQVRKQAPSPPCGFSKNDYVGGPARRTKAFKAQDGNSTTAPPRSAIVGGALTAFAAFETILTQRGRGRYSFWIHTLSRRPPDFEFSAYL
jgi:hypothetical protein